MKRRRPLTADDRTVWQAVARTVAPAREKSDPVIPSAAPSSPPARPPRHNGAETALGRGTLPAAWRSDGPPAAPNPQRPAKGSARFMPGEARPTQVGRPEAGLDRRTAERLRRGDRDPDARLDLHGMTADRAHAALDRFIGEARRRGHRCVLVITGKGGRRAPEDAPWLEAGIGVLRDAVPRWIRSGPHGRDIVGIFEAHQRHGGAGALYIYLKRRRPAAR
ncbi:MAG: Smr/MutS family protein [Pseudomonadota bacterium]